MRRGTEDRDAKASYDESLAVFVTADLMAVEVKVLATDLGAKVWCGTSPPSLGQDLAEAEVAEQIRLNGLKRKVEAIGDARHRVALLPLDLIAELVPTTNA